MKESSDELIVSNSQQPAVGDYLSGTQKELGHECEFTVRARLKSQTPEGSTWSIVAVVPPGYEYEPKVPSDQAVGGPMMTEASMNVRKSMAQASSGY